MGIVSLNKKWNVIETHRHWEIYERYKIIEPITLYIVADFDFIICKRPPFVVDTKVNFMKNHWEMKKS